MIAKILSENSNQPHPEDINKNKLNEKGQLKKFEFLAIQVSQIENLEDIKKKILKDGLSVCKMLNLSGQNSLRTRSSTVQD